MLIAERQNCITLDWEGLKRLGRMLGRCEEKKKKDEQKEKGMTLEAGKNVEGGLVKELSGREGREKEGGDGDVKMDEASEEGGVKE